MKKLANFKKGIKTVNKEEINLIKGGNTNGFWEWVWFAPIQTWLYIWRTGI